MSDFTIRNNKASFSLFLLLCSTFLFGQALLDEDFNGSQFPPEGWSVNSTVSGQYTWHNYPSSNYGATILENQPLNQNEWLITPVIDLQNYNKIYLEIDVLFVSEYSMTHSIDFFVKVSTDGGTTWQTIASDNTMNYIFNESDNQFSYDVSDYTGQGMDNIKFSFQFLKTGSSLQSSFIHIRNVSLTECPRPKFVGSTATTVEWLTPDNFDGTYEIQYGDLGFAEGTGTTVTGIIGNSYTLPDMDCNYYDIYIRTNCGDSTGKWTGYRHDNIYSFSISEVSENSALLTINGLADSYDIAYRTYDPYTGNHGSFTYVYGVEGSTFQLNDLLLCREYQIMSKSSCNPSTLWEIAPRFLTYNNSIYPLPYSYSFSLYEFICQAGYWTNNRLLNDRIADWDTTTYLFMRNFDINNIFGVVYTPKFNFENNQTYNIALQFRNGGVAGGEYPNSTPVNPISLTIELVNSVTNEVSYVGEISGVFNTTTLTSNQFSFVSDFSGVGYLRFTMNNPNSTIHIKDIQISSSPLSVTDISHNQFKIYPNPVTDMMNISSGNDLIEKIELLDMQGKAIRNIKGNNQSEVQVSLQYLPNAIYLVKVKTDKGIKTLKVVKS